MVWSWSWCHYIHSVLMGVAIWTKIWKVFGNCLGEVLSTCCSGPRYNTPGEADHVVFEEHDPSAHVLPLVDPPPKIPLFWDPDCQKLVRGVLDGTYSTGTTGGRTDEENDFGTGSTGTPGGSSVEAETSEDVIPESGHPSPVEVPLVPGKITSSPAPEEQRLPLPEPGFDEHFLRPRRVIAQMLNPPLPEDLLQRRKELETTRQRLRTLINMRRVLTEPVDAVGSSDPTGPPGNFLSQLGPHDEYPEEILQDPAYLISHSAVDAVLGLNHKGAVSRETLALFQTSEENFFRQRVTDVRWVQEQITNAQATRFRRNPRLQYWSAVGRAATGLGPSNRGRDSEGPIPAAYTPNHLRDSGGEPVAAACQDRERVTSDPFSSFGDAMVVGRDDRREGGKLVRGGGKDPRRGGRRGAVVPDAACQDQRRDSGGLTRERCQDSRVTSDPFSSLGEGGGGTAEDVGDRAVVLYTHEQKQKEKLRSSQYLWAEEQFAKNNTGAPQQRTAEADLAAGASNVDHFLAGPLPSRDHFLADLAAGDHFLAAKLAQSLRWHEDKQRLSHSDVRPQHGGSNAMGVGSSSPVLIHPVTGKIVERSGQTAEPSVASPNARGKVPPWSEKSVAAWKSKRGARRRGSLNL